MKLNDISQSLRKIFQRNHEQSHDAVTSLITKAEVIFVLGLTIIIFSISFVEIFDHLQSKNVHPSVAIDTNRWIATFNNSTYPPDNLQAVKEREELESTINHHNFEAIVRGSQKYYVTLAELRDQQYWLTTVIEPDELNLAHRNGANNLVLGLFDGNYEIWVDNNLFENANSHTNEFLINIKLPLNRLGQNQAMPIAIKLQNTIDAYSADDYNMPAGFFTTNQTATLLRWSIFEGQARHLTFIGIYFILGLLFFISWLADKKTTNNCTISQFALVNALLHLIYLDSFYNRLTISTWYQIFSPLVMIEAFYILLVSLSISRANRNIIKAVYGILFLAPLLLLTLALSAVELRHLTHIIQTYLFPAMYFIGGIICLIQFKTIKNREEIAVTRKHQLLVVAILYIITAISFARESMSLTYPITNLHWSQLFNLIILLYFTTIISRRIKNQIDDYRKIPISDYHRTNPLPEKIHGTLMVFDLKSSEKLFRRGAKIGAGGSLVSIILSHVWSTVASYKGQILQTEGDSLAVWFIGEPNKPPTVDLLALCDNIERVLGHLSQTMIESDIEMTFSQTIHYRAAFTNGSIKPIWRSVGAEQFPAWLEAGSSNVFVDAARLLEIEKNIALDQPQSCILIHQPLKDQLTARANAQGTWLKENAVAISKHGEQYNYSAYLPAAKKTHNIYIAHSA